MNTVPASSNDLSVAADIDDNDDPLAFKARESLAAGSFDVMFWVFDPRNGRLLHTSPSIDDLSRELGCEVSGHMGGWLERVSPAERPDFEHFLDAQGRGEAAEAEFGLRATDGSMRWLHGRIFPWLDGDGRALVAGVAEDISERRRIESKRLDNALRQRDSLVREAHHRIKNSLQGVIGLLRQCAGRRPELASDLTGAISQVRSIATIHELLSGSGGGPVLLSELLPMIANAIEGLFDTRVRIRIDTRLDRSVMLADSEAVPLAVSLGELLMNAVKHRRCSHVTDDPHVIEVEISGNGERTLIHISNCGVLPPKFDYAGHKGLGHGLALLSILLPGGHASLEYSSQSGWVHARLTLLPPAIGIHEHTHRPSHARFT